MNQNEFRPDDIEGLCALIREQVSAGQAIYPRGGGHVDGLRRRAQAARGHRGHPVADRVIDYPSADMTITVEAGMTLAGTARASRRAKRQRLLVDAPEPDTPRWAASTPPTPTGPPATAPAGPATRSSGSAS